MSILQSVMVFFRKCPFLRSGPLGVDFLGAKPCGYTVDAIPSSPIVKQYIDGSSIRQFLFVFASRESYGVQQDNLENASFYERLADWLEQESRAERLPVLPDDKQSLAISASTGGYVLQTGAREARYQMQCKLTYFQGVSSDECK